jgi:hypothetical protein
VPLPTFALNRSTQFRELRKKSCPQQGIDSSAVFYLKFLLLGRRLQSMNFEQTALAEKQLWKQLSPYHFPVQVLAFFAKARLLACAGFSPPAGRHLELLF